MRGFEKLARQHRILARWAELVDVTADARTILGDADLVIWDVGAAWGLPPHLLALQRAAQFNLVEPDRDAADALQSWHSSAGDDRNVHVHCVGVSEFGGRQNLYVYDGDPTGASLLRPLPERIREAGEPTTISIETTTLRSLIDSAHPPRCDFVKLDIQGAELAALRGAGETNLDQLLGCELEIGMPGVYEGQPSLEATRLELAEHGLELIDIRPARAKADAVDGVPTAWLDSRGHSQRISEVDALFMRRPANLESEPAVYARMCVLFAAYGYFVDAGNVVKAGVERGVITAARDQQMIRALDHWVRTGYRDLGITHGPRHAAATAWNTLKPSPMIRRGRTLWRWSAD